MKQETKTIILVAIPLLSIILCVLDAFGVVDNFIPGWLIGSVRRIIEVL